MKLDELKKLHQKKYRIAFGHYLVEGEHLILELCKSLDTDAASDVTLYVSDKYVDWASRLPHALKCVHVNDKQMSNICDTKTPQGIVACVPLPVNSHNADNALQTNPTTSKHKHIYLHEVQDPGNLGTIIRSLAWFGDFKLLLSPNSVDPFNPKVVRASMGAIFHVPIEFDVNIEELHTRFSSFAYLDMEGDEVNSQAFSDYECYLFGNEARGVPSQSLLDTQAHAFTIKGSGKIDSLNLASAVNICLYQLSVN